MTNRRGRGPEPDDDHTNLSQDDVERRLDGGAGLGGPVAERVPAVTPTPAPRRPRARGGAVLWRDVLLVLVLLGFLGAGAQFVLNPASSVSSPGPGSSTVALASPASSPPLTATVAVPIASATEPALPSDVIGSLLPEEPSPPSAAPSPTPSPVVTPTPGPGATPKPTPAPTANLVISVLPMAATGGNDVAADWQIAVSGANPSKTSFAGSQSGTAIKVTAGKKYSIATTPATPGGYTQSFSGNCTGPLAAGAQAQCTITETEKPERLTVYVLGLPHASDVTVTMSGSGQPSLPQTFQGDAGGTRVALWSNRAFTVSASDAAGYVQSTSGACAGSLQEGEITQCTFIYSVPPPAPSQGVLLPLLLPFLGLRSLQWRARRRRRAVI
jgi:hypothetical protein